MEKHLRKFTGLFVALLLTLGLMVAPVGSHAESVYGAGSRHAGLLTGAAVGGGLGYYVANKATDTQTNNSDWSTAGAATGALLGGTVGHVFFDGNSTPDNSALFRHGGAVLGTGLGGLGGYTLGSNICDGNAEESDCAMGGMLIGAVSGATAGHVLLDNNY